MITTNKLLPMTRRYPNLPQKVLYKDSEIMKKMVNAWDIEGDADKLLDIFINEKRLLSNERYWEMLRSVWVCCGNVENAQLFRELMQSKRPQRFYFSTPEEAESLRKMPSTFWVYRATNNADDGGLSWTLSLDYAKEYQKKFSKSMILQKEVSKNQVFAYIERNFEYEIVIL